MMKLAQRVALLAVIALGGSGVFAGTASAQKIAVIDVQAAMATLPEAQAAQQRLEGVRKAWTDSLQMMRTAYQSKMDAYSKVGDTGTPDFKKKAAEDLSGLENSYMKFQQEKFGQEGELAGMQQQLLKPILEKMTAALEAYGKKEKITAILYKNATAYYDPAVDMTQKFADYLKTVAQK